MLHTIKKISSLITILMISGCSNKTEETVKGKDLLSPINIEKFLINCQKIDTFKLRTEMINQKFGFDYVAYNHYEALNTNLNGKGMFRYNDYLITGKDSLNKETVLCFFSKNLRKGNELWGQTIINQPKKNVLKLLKNQINDDSYPLKYYYGIYKGGYNIVLYSDDDINIDGFLVVKSEKEGLIRHSINLANQFNYFDGKSPD